MSTLDLSPVLDRITYRPAAPKLNPIPWPDGLAPQPQNIILIEDGPLPAADVLVITWTAAEAMALADVLTPGVHSDSWAAYRKNWDTFEPQLTSRSPARESRRLGSAQLTKIGSKLVCLLKSELHPATDGPTLPTAQLAAQAAADTRAGLVITTGTAGGAGDGTLLGDVCVATGIHADFTTRLKGHLWSQEQWPAMQGEYALPLLAGPLFTANSSRLPEAPRQPKIWNGHVVSTDYFAFASRDDHYGLMKYDPEIRAVEMDDAAVAAGVSGMDKPPALASIRNASDPVMPDGSEASARQASEIYRRYGYFTTINSAIACWAMIAEPQTATA
jgi:nucleoside phosphorylase